MPHYECPNHCEIDCDTPFYVAAGCVTTADESGSEIGILVYANGDLSNRWADGTAGIPESTQELTQDHIDGGCPPHCITCHEEARWITDREVNG